MLFTDALFVSQADLLVVDSEAAMVAEAQQAPIVIEGEDGIISFIYAECLTLIMSRLMGFGLYSDPNGLGQAHLAAVFQGSGDGVRERATVEQIVVDDGYPVPSALKQWVIYRVLRHLYSDAYSRSVDDRYETKMLLWESRANDAWAQLTRRGFPVVNVPISRPGAKYVEGAGSWDAGDLSAVPGGSSLQVDLKVAITFVGNAYLNQIQRNNSESAASDVLDYTLSAAHVLAVSIAELTPPAVATGWNVYVGTGDILYLQNDSPIPIETKSYELDGEPVLNGYKLRIGQQRNTCLLPINSLNRA